MTMQLLSLVNNDIPYNNKHDSIIQQMIKLGWLVTHYHMLLN